MTTTLMGCRAGTPPTLDAELREQIHSLWDELAAFEAAQSDVALLHLLSTVAGMVGAENAYWFGAVRVTDAEHDPLLGWRPRCIRYLKPLPDDSTFTRDRIRSIDRGVADEAMVAQARLSGTYRANRLRDLVSDEWFSSDTYQDYLTRGVHDSLAVGAPVSPTAEGYYGFLRLRPDDPFAETDRDIALYAMRGLTWFHRQVMLAHGLLVARSPLSPIERRVLALLLTDQSEKLIASALGLSPSSLHTYVRDVLRKFGVSGRKGPTAGPSGVNTCTSPAATTDGTGIVFNCTATAGNGKTASRTTLPARRDATPPTVTYSTHPAAYTVDQSVSIMCTPADNLSGVASSSCANITGDGYTFALGTNAFSAKATDNAGNMSAAVSTSFTMAVTQASLCALVERWTSNSGVAHSLCVKLQHGDYEPFRNELSAQSGKKISDTNAAILLRLVNAL